MYIFLDLETTGLNPQSDLILEVGIAVTDDDFEIVDERNYLWPMSSWIQEKLDRANSVVTEMHTANHLIAEMHKLAAEGNHMSYNFYRRCLEVVLLDWFTMCGLKPGEIEMGGNTVHFDRAFLKDQMPQLEAFFHYRNFDVRTLKSAVERWAPAYWKAQPIFHKEDMHRALDDVHEDIETARVIRDLFVSTSTTLPPVVS